MSFFNKIRLIYQVLFDKDKCIDLTLVQNTEGYSDISQKIECFAELNMLLMDMPDAGIMLHAYRQIKKEHPNFSPFFIFEDPDQCQYTNMHASTDEFYFDEEAFLSKASKEDLPLARYQFVLEKLNESDKQCSLKDIVGVLDYEDEDEIKALKKINRLGYTPVYEDTLIYLLPTQNSKEIFARMINGYFSGDLNPRQNYALISHLVDNYGYTFMGMGATVLMFVREKDLDIQAGEKLMKELAPIYNFSDETLKKLLDLPCIHKHLILPYGETLLDIMDDD